MEYGIDFSFGSGVTTAQIKDAGKSFVVRYLSGGSSKDVSSLELKNYKAAGIPVAFVWETNGVDMTSRTAGINDAHGAQAELDGLANGVGDQSLRGAPVFFAADEQTEPDLVDYLEGVASVIGKGRTGIYGGIGSVSTAFNHGLVAFGWQTIAWSNGLWDDRALLRQLNSGKVGPASVDFDEAAFWAIAKKLTLADDFGQWPRPSSHTPPPSTGPYRHEIGLGDDTSLAKFAADRHTTVDAIVKLSLANVGPGNAAILNGYLAYDNVLVTNGAPHPVMPANLVIYTENA